MTGRQKNEQFLHGFGGQEANDLTNLLNFESEFEENAGTIINVSNYHDLEDLLNKTIFTKNDQFKMISFNTESINSKLDNIKLFLESLKQNNIFFDSICINECWLDEYGDDLNLDGYSSFPLSRKVGMKGGLITYILEDYNVNELNVYTDSTTWEGQFFEIKGNGLRTKLLLGNLYVPPRSNEFTDFKKNFIPIIEKLSDKYRHIIITGDTNIDALKFNSNTQFSNYFDSITNNGLLPVITLPTHFGSKNGSIIDHIYVKTDIDLANLYAGISLHSFSHHLPVFISMPLKNEVVELPKYITITKNDSQSWNNLISDLNDINWQDVFDTQNLFSNPSNNYTKFINKIIDLKNKHLPTKKVRFKRYKHKNNNWITNGLLTSIKQKDYLYKQMHSLQSNHPNYENIKSQYKTYEKNLKNLIYTVKKDFFNRQFMKFRSDIKNTWKTIKNVLNKNRSTRKMQTKFCVNGNIIEGDLKIANEFNKFFFRNWAFSCFRNSTCEPHSSNTIISIIKHRTQFLLCFNHPIGYSENNKKL